MNTPEPNSGEKASAIDTSFPTLLLMGIGLAVAVVCIVICGWKIILMEHEQREIVQERLLLERDRDAFLTYGSELPRLEAEHRRLGEEIAARGERQKELDNEIKKLLEERERLRVETNGLTGGIAALQGQLEALRTQLGEEQADLARLEPLLAGLRKENATLAAEEKSLRASIAEKHKQEGALLASVASLEQSREHLRTLLERMSSDKEYYAGLEKNFDAALEKFDAILSKSGALTSAYAERVEDMGRFKATLDQGMAVLSSDLKGMAANLEAMKQERASQAALLKQGAEQAKQMREQVDALGANGKKFAAVMESARTVDQKLQAALAAESAALSRLAQEDAKTRANLAAAAETLGQTAESFKEEQTRARANVADFAGLINQQKEELAKLQTLAASLGETAEKNRDTALEGIKSGAKFAEAAQNLQTRADDLKERLEQTGGQTALLRQFLDSGGGRLEEWSRLAQATREELVKSKEQAAQAQAMLARIEELLARRGEPGAPATGEEGEAMKPEERVTDERN